ncbi:hypothetical protein WICPIJ_005809 [Wickerhamomyces pijperi]|uniref:Uncharacterized protein n=1 Tax=Wickerhamomyces pijperi TaxID=599730 RepID=A0A9P8Q5L3_WICPI|nr:hypothetical protein WICPIJ_005809 [Wickerhamomyces pijperi]
MKEQRGNSIDLEKNIFQERLTTPKPSHSKQFIYALTVIHVVLVCINIVNHKILVKFHPLLNSITLGVLTSGLAQCCIQCFKPVSYKKLMKFYVWGSVNGVLSSMYIDYLLSMFPEDNQLVPRFLTDQIIAGPLFQFVFMSFHCLWEDIDLVSTLKAGFMRNLMASYCVWPIASIIGFGGWIDESWIFSFNCFVSLVWTVVLVQLEALQSGVATEEELISEVQLPLREIDDVARLELQLSGEDIREERTGSGEVKHRLGKVQKGNVLLGLGSLGEGRDTVESGSSPEEALIKSEAESAMDVSLRSVKETPAVNTVTALEQGQTLVCCNPKRAPAATCSCEAHLVASMVANVGLKITLVLLWEGRGSRMFKLSSLWFNLFERMSLNLALTGIKPEPEELKVEDSPLIKVGETADSSTSKSMEILEKRPVLEREFSMLKSSSLTALKDKTAFLSAASCGKMFLTKFS